MSANKADGPTSDSVNGTKGSWGLVGLPVRAKKLGWHLSSDGLGSKFGEPGLEVSRLHGLCCELIEEDN